MTFNISSQDAILATSKRKRIINIANNSGMNKLKGKYKTAPSEKKF